MEGKLPSLGRKSLDWAEANSPWKEAVVCFGITTEIPGPEPISACFLGGTMRRGIRERPV